MAHNTLLRVGLVQPAFRFNSELKRDLIAVLMDDSYKFNRNKHGDKMGDKTFDTWLRCLY